MTEYQISIDDLPTVVRVSNEEPPEHFAIQCGERCVRPVMLTNLKQLYAFLATADNTQAPTIVNLSYKIAQQLGEELRNTVVTITTLVETRFSPHTAKVTVMVNDPITKDEAKRFRDCGITGLIPTLRDFGWQAMQESYNVLLDPGTTHWPKVCIKVIENPSKQNKPAGIELTDRQQEVQKLLCERGLSNKAIARQLNISESTVKIHVSAILKRYGVRNRTQLALAVNNGARL